MVKCALAQETPLHVPLCESIMFRYLLSFLVLTLVLPAAAAVDFAHQIVPILKKHCAECHAGDQKKGGFSFNTRDALLDGGENGAVIAQASPDKSRLIEVILSTDSDDQMPPKGDRLSAAEVALLKSWIAADLPWEQGFAFKKPAYEPPLKPRRPALPSAVGKRTHPLDRLIDQYLADHHREPPAPIDDATFARRLHLDLIGLLPDPAALQAFLKDAAPDKRARLIARLLSNDQAYAEHWLTFWNDLLRNDYSGTGFITGGRKQISKWLYDSLIHNKPADQMARELIAPPGDESRGFIEGIKWRGDVSAGQTTEIQFAQSVSQSFLGINMKCASCHDSFIDRWKLDEAYGLAAIFSTRPLEIARCDKPTGRLAQASWLFPELGQVDPKATQPERLKQLAALMTQAQVARAATADAERNRALDNVITGCSRAARIVDQMLTLARLEPDTALGTREVFDLHALAQSVVADIAPAALQQGVEIELGDCADTSISGNSDLIRIALRNLIDNAVRYSARNTRVQVTIDKSGDFASARVTDQGPGLSSEERQKAGQRFYRVLGNNAAGIVQISNLLIILALSALTGILLLAAEPVEHLLGEQGLMVVTRIFGLLLLAIGISTVITGVSGALPGLAH